MERAPKAHTHVMMYLPGGVAPACPVAGTACARTCPASSASSPGSGAQTLYDCRAERGPQS